MWQDIVITKEQQKTRSHPSPLHHKQEEPIDPWYCNRINEAQKCFSSLIGQKQHKMDRWVSQDCSFNLCEKCMQVDKWAE